MVRFGKWNIYNPALSFFGKVGYFVHGVPNIAQFFQSHYFRKYTNKIINDKTQAVLDVGCGGGDYSFYLAEKYPQLRIDAMDISKEGIEAAKKIHEKTYLNNIQFIHSDFENFTEGKKYSLVILPNVLPEVKNKADFIRKALKFVEFGGYIFIQTQVPNAYSKSITAAQEFYAYKERHFKGKQLYGKEVLMLLKQEGFRVITHKNVIGFFAQAGWEMDYAIRRMNLKYLRTFCLPILKLVCSLDFLLPIGNKNEWIIIARRNDSTETL